MLIALFPEKVLYLNIFRQLQGRSKILLVSFVPKINQLKIVSIPPKGILWSSKLCFPSTAFLNVYSGELRLHPQNNFYRKVWELLGWTKTQSLFIAGHLSIFNL